MSEQTFGPNNWTFEQAMQAAYDWGRLDEKSASSGQPLPATARDLGAGLGARLDEPMSVGGVELAALRERYAGRTRPREATEAEVAEITGLDVHTASTAAGGHTMHPGAREACPQCAPGGGQ